MKINSRDVLGIIGSICVIVSLFIPYVKLGVKNYGLRYDKIYSLFDGDKIFPIMIIIVVLISLFLVLRSESKKKKSLYFLISGFFVLGTYQIGLMQTIKSLPPFYSILSFENGYYIMVIGSVLLFLNGFLHIFPTHISPVLDYVSKKQLPGILGCISIIFGMFMPFVSIEGIDITLFDMPKQYVLMFIIIVFISLYSIFKVDSNIQKSISFLILGPATYLAYSYLMAVVIKDLQSWGLIGLIMVRNFSWGVALYAFFFGSILLFLNGLTGIKYIIAYIKSNII